MAFQLNEKFRLFALNSTPELTAEIAAVLNCEVGSSAVTKFSDGEIQINIQESVRGCEVYVVQSTQQPGNEYIMELLIMIDALRRASAKTINVVIPYYGYARQDRKARAREPITAKLIANLLEAAGVDRIISVDLHAAQIQGFFDIPVDQLTGIPILYEHFRQKELADVVVVAPNTSGLVRARRLASRLNAPIAFVDKRRPKPDAPQIVNVVGEVKGKNAIIIDDLIDTGGTVTLASAVLMEHGAESVYACCTHPVLSGPAVEWIEASAIKEIVVTNTIELPEEKKFERLTVLSVAPLLADAISRVHNQQSVSVLFD
ncbi:ribose-phosphate diphosphokinase [Planococcus lenghuensis]|uniref:Ribose-phosphate pyrophosphokinase n=1 Tax=Planococcus lenghuensis TaxID=2213202 RepID=A0A1Q2L349_9BACL|nr:ribose-phosphate pyrophosphokinase [Planococcus lenghuensis]AQQ54794.1 ribose-phosphate pyrophosphokinase [Planococcus lenghuensis]